MGNRELPREMVAGAEDALSNLDSAIRLYLFERHRPSYRTVLMNIRILLFDFHNTKNFGDRWSGQCLLEAVYGDGGDIFLQSLNAKAYGLDDVRRQSGVAPGFEISSDPEYKLRVARISKYLIPLPQWKDEKILWVRNKILTTECVLSHLADKEGAHNISRQHKKDWRNHLLGAAIESETLDRQETHARHFDVPTEQFVVNAGTKLLFARKMMNNHFVKLFDYPVTRITDYEINDFNIRKAKPKIAIRFEDPKPL